MLSVLLTSLSDASRELQRTSSPTRNLVECPEARSPDVLETTWWTHPDHDSGSKVPAKQVVCFRNQLWAGLLRHRPTAKGQFREQVCVCEP